MDQHFTPTGDICVVIKYYLRFIISLKHINTCTDTIHIVIDTVLILDIARVLSVVIVRVKTMYVSNNLWNCVLSVLVIECVIIVRVNGHGRLLDPPQRSSMWRFGFKNPVNYNDNELFCGGYRVRIT
jgi:hypothetical protein